MAYIRLNPSSLHLDVLVGVKETYTPNEQIIKASEEVDLLKNQTQEFLSKYWANKTNSELQKIFKNSESERKLWQDYLESEYNPKLKELLTKIEELNKSFIQSS